jgi:hypothetical protein
MPFHYRPFMRLSMRGLARLEIFLRMDIKKIPFSTEAGAAASQRGYPSKAGAENIRGYNPYGGRAGRDHSPWSRLP